ncbi:MAG: histidine kinase N-terminal domain-containing protein, partial [Ilumatobacteraceae bacterium]
MATLADFVRQHTDLPREDAAHLQQLIGEWGMLADLSFADLVLYLRDRNGNWIVGAQVRPATGRTIYPDDLVGGWANEATTALVDRAFHDGDVGDAEIQMDDIEDPVHVLAIPVRSVRGSIAV